MSFRDLLTTYTSPSQASRPNKRSFTPKEKNIDQFKRNKDAIDKLEAPSLDNMKEPSTFFCISTIIVSKHNLDYYGKVSSIILNPEHDRSRPPPAVGTTPTPIEPTFGDIQYDEMHNFCMLHYGLVLNGSSVLIDKTCTHMQMTIAVEEFSTDVGGYARAGMQGLIHWPVDDVMVGTIVPNSWKNEPNVRIGGEPGCNEWTDVSREFRSTDMLGQWYAGRTVGSSRFRPTLKRRRTQTKTVAQSIETVGGKKKSRNPGKPPGPPPPPPPPPIPNVDCNNPPQTAIGSSPSSWRRNSASKTQSFWRAINHEPEIAKLFEKYKDSSGNVKEWGPKFEDSKPPGLPHLCRPVASRKSSLLMFNHYVNQVTTMPADHHWWMKLLVIGLSASESGFLFGLPANRFEMRPKIGPDYCKTTIERGQEFGTRITKRINSLVDGPRPASIAAPTTAYGFHQCNFDRWFVWRRDIGMPEQHVVHQTVKDEALTPFLYYYEYDTLNSSTKKSVHTVQAAFNTFGANLQTVMYAAALASDHHGPGYKVQFNYVAGVNKLPATLPDFEVKGSASSGYTTCAQLDAFATVAGATGGAYDKAGLLRSVQKKQKEIKRFLKKSTILGNIVDPKTGAVLKAR